MPPVVYIKVPTYLKQWACHAYGSPVVFPAIGNEVAVIRRFMSLPPHAVLSPIDAESTEEILRAKATRQHRSMESISSDEEYEHQLWTIKPEEYVAVRLPESKSKPSREYCYLGPYARKAVEEMMVDLFKIDLWASLKDIADRSCRLSTLISAWCEMRGISIDYEDTVRQCFYRIRCQHTKKGLNLCLQTRNNKI